MTDSAAKKGETAAAVSRLYQPIAERGEFEGLDTGPLTNDDWTLLKKLAAAQESGDDKAFELAADELAKDPVQFSRIFGVFFREEWS